MNRTRLLHAAPLLLLACDPDTADCEVAGGASSGTVNAESDVLTVSGAIYSRCTVASVEVGRWPTKTTLGDAGQTWTVSIPLADLSADAAGDPGTVANVCAKPELVWGMDTATGEVLLPVAAWLFDQTHACLDSVVWTDGRAAAEGLALSLDPQVPQWLPSSGAGSLAVYAEAPEGAAGTEITWTVAGATSSATTSTLLPSTSCPSLVASCALAQTSVKAAAAATSALITASSETGAASRSVPIYGAPRFTVTGTLVPGGGGVTVRVEGGQLETASLTGGLPTTPISSCDPLVAACAMGEAWTFNVAAAHDTPRGESLAATVYDAWGQSATSSTWAVDSNVTTLTLVASESWLPATVPAPPVVVTATANEAAIGASITWTETGSSLSGGSTTLIADPTCTASPCAATASVMLAAEHGVDAVYLLASAGAVATAISIPVVGVPSLSVDATTIERGSGATSTVVVGTGGVLDGYSETGCDDFDVAAAGCLGTASCSLGQGDNIAVTQAAAGAQGTCTITVVDTFGQTSSIDVGLNPAPVTDLALDVVTDGATPGWIPNDGATAAMLTVSVADVDAIGAEVSLQPSGATLTLEWDGDAGAWATALFTSTTPGTVTLRANSGAASSETEALIVAGAPAVSPSAAELTTGASASLLFTSDGVLATCGYTGGAFSVEDGIPDGSGIDAVAGAGGERVAIEAGLGGVVVMTVSSPTIAAEAWCQDEYGRVSTAAITLATVE
jgi:hypothetical protein